MLPSFLAAAIGLAVAARTAVATVLPRHELDNLHKRDALDDCLHSKNVPVTLGLGWLVFATLYAV